MYVSLFPWLGLPSSTFGPHSIVSNGAFKRGRRLFKIASLCPVFVSFDICFQEVYTGMID